MQVEHFAIWQNAGSIGVRRRGRNDRRERRAKKHRAAAIKWRRGRRKGAGKPLQIRPKCFSGKFFDSSGDTACKKIKKS